MSKKDSKQQDNSEAADSATAQENNENSLPNQKKAIPDIRLECLKLSHSALKSVDLILADAAVYTDWVVTGQIKPK